VTIVTGAVRFANIRPGTRLREADSMKLVTFHHSGRGDRIGAVAADGSIVDLNAAYALYLRNVEREGAFYALADARVPARDAGAFREWGSRVGRCAEGAGLRCEGRPKGLQVRQARRSCSAEIRFASRRRLFQRSFLHTAGIFASTTPRRRRRDFRIRCLPWIDFFKM